MGYERFGRGRMSIGSVSITPFVYFFFVFFVFLFVIFGAYCGYGVPSRVPSRVPSEVVPSIALRSSCCISSSRLTGLLSTLRKNLDAMVGKNCFELFMYLSRMASAWTSICEACCRSSSGTCEGSTEEVVRRDEFINQLRGSRPH
jgi:hypothetical protein